MNEKRFVVYCSAIGGNENREYRRMEKSMKFGYFDDENREYVITTPKTPLPWINYLGCRDFFTLLSNTCGGYSFYKDAKLLRLTRYRYNDVPMENTSILKTAIPYGTRDGSL